MSCCVGMCCRESSWLGVRRMLRNESPSLRRIRRTPRARTSSHSLKPRASKGIHNFIHKDNHFHQFQPFPEPSYLIFWTWWSSIIAEFHHITLELFHSVPCVCVCVCVCVCDVCVCSPSSTLTTCRAFKSFKPLADAGITCCITLKFFKYPKILFICWAWLSYVTAITLCRSFKDWFL